MVILYASRNPTSQFQIPVRATTRVPESHVYPMRTPKGGQQGRKRNDLMIMPPSRAGVPLHEFMHVLFDEGCRWPGIVQVCFPLKARGESIPIVHCLRHRRTLWVADQYIGDQSSLQPITIYGFLRRSCLHSCCSPLF